MFITQYVILPLLGLSLLLVFIGELLTGLSLFLWILLGLYDAMKAIFGRVFARQPSTTP